MCQDSNSQALEDEDRREFLERRKELADLGASQLATFDKTLLFLASGAIGLSVVFAQALSLNGEIKQIDVLGLSWGLFVFSLLANMLSYVSGWLDTKREIDFMDEHYPSGWREPHENPAREVTSTLNFFAGLSFAMGIIPLLVFTFNNLGG